MKRQFDPEAIRAQIANLTADRARIDRAIESLEDALHGIEKMEAPQTELALDANDAETTLHDAVKRACMAMIDGITRQRVIAAVERKHPTLHPKSPSVAAALANLTKGAAPILGVAIEGSGRSPSFYSTEENIVLHLASDEIDGLLDENATHGTGGWQSLWLGLLKQFDKSKGTITLNRPFGTRWRLWSARR